MSWKKSVKQERKQLHKRLVKLQSFLDSPESAQMSIPMHSLLMRQKEVMAQYMYILNERLADLKDD